MPSGSKPLSDPSLTQICVALWRHMSRNDKCAYTNASKNALLLTFTILIIIKLSAKYIWEMFVHSKNHCVPICCIATHLFVEPMHRNKPNIIYLFSLNNYPHCHIQLSPFWSNWVHCIFLCLPQHLRVIHGCADLQPYFVVFSMPSGVCGCNIHTMEMAPSRMSQPWPYGEMGVCGLGLKQHGNFIIPMVTQFHS